jgi:hypothetical protein
LFSNTLSLCSSHSVRDQVSHPYKTSILKTDGKAEGSGLRGTRSILQLYVKYAFSSQVLQFKK